ncbi:MAG: hypothetical protein E6Q84_00725 [Thiothrix sp.]|nr:MAG: hypothetical protein E6Q84_00725 [Thiothrix sp.]
MASYQLPYHQLIAGALKQFNADFLIEHTICFGGGTRIALELDEYRESVDIDFLCPNIAAYRAVREQITTASLGSLVQQEFEYLREIRADRYAVRTFLKLEHTVVKLEIVSCDEYRLTAGFDKTIFPVPYLSPESCWITKLLANADRALAPPFKDVFDLVAMHVAWGAIPQAAWGEAERHYGIVPHRELLKALEAMLAKPEFYLARAADMKMKPDWAKRIVYQGADELYQSVKS